MIARPLLLTCFKPSHAARLARMSAPRFFPCGRSHSPRGASSFVQAGKQVLCLESLSRRKRHIFHGKAAVGMAAYPLIGVSGSIDAEETRHFILRDYLTAVIAAGGVPVLLSPDMEGDMLEDCLARLDGLLMAGGNDVSPALFGEPPVEALGEVNPLRDGFEMRLVRLAAARLSPCWAYAGAYQAMAARWAARCGRICPASTVRRMETRHRTPADMPGALCQPYRVRSPRYAAGRASQTAQERYASIPSIIRR